MNGFAVDTSSLATAVVDPATWERLVAACRECGYALIPLERLDGVGYVVDHKRSALFVPKRWEPR